MIIKNHMLVKLMNALGLYLDGAGARLGIELTPGQGAAVSGGLQALGTIYSAYLQTKEAKKEREQARLKHNADTKLQISQYNQNNDRLAGLAGVASGQEEYQQNLAKSAFNDNNAGVNWDNKYAMDKASGAITNNNITNGESYKNSQLNSSINAANDLARAEFTNKGDYKNMDANKYTI